MTILYQPEPQHTCGPNEYGYWEPYRTDPAGTVRRCGECGQTWVAYQAHEPSMFTTGVLWRRETRLGAIRRYLRRWWRELR